MCDLVLLQLFLTGVTKKNFVPRVLSKSKHKKSTLCSGEKKINLLPKGHFTLCPGNKKNQIFEREEERKKKKFAIYPLSREQKIKFLKKRLKLQPTLCPGNKKNQISERKKNYNIPFVQGTKLNYSLFLGFYNKKNFL